MVPVPEELVAEVKDHLDWNLAAQVDPNPNPEAIAEVWGGADATMRAVLWHTAEQCTDDRPPTLTELADHAEVSIHALVGLIADLAARSRAAGGPMALLMPRPDVRPRPDGVSEWEHRICAMTKPVAERILSL